MQTTGAGYPSIPANDLKPEVNDIVSYWDIANQDGPSYAVIAINSTPGGRPFYMLRELGTDEATGEFLTGYGWGLESWAGDDETSDLDGEEWAKVKAFAAARQDAFEAMDFLEDTTDPFDAYMQAALPNVPASIIAASLEA